jgi:hypothetical protein
MVTAMVTVMHRPIFLERWFLEGVGWAVGIQPLEGALSCPVP